MRSFRVFLICLFLSGSIVVRSDAGENVLTWRDCVREARQSHPDLISAAEQLKQTRADQKSARATALPQINSGVSGQRTTAGGRETNAFSYSVSGKQLIFDGSKTSNEIKSAGENIRASAYNYTVTSSNIRLKLKEAFAGLLRAQKFVSLTESILERRRQNLKLVQLRHDAGREHKGSLLTAEADLANAEFEVGQAKRNVSLARTQLAKAMGREDDESFRVVGSFDASSEYGDEPDFSGLADHTPMLKEYASKKDAARFGLNSQKASFLPEVYLSTSAGRSGADWPPDDNSWGMGLSLSFPLFEGGSRAAGVEKAASKLAQAAADERSGRDSIILTLKETWMDLMDALGLVSVQKKFLDAAEERAKIANAQYSTGLITFDDWIIIEDNLVSSRKSYLNARTNVLIAEARWVQAKGGALDYDDEDQG